MHIFPLIFKGLQIIKTKKPAPLSGQAALSDSDHVQAKPDHPFIISCLQPLGKIVKHNVHRFPNSKVTMMGISKSLQVPEIVYSYCWWKSLTHLPWKMGHSPQPTSNLHPVNNSNSFNEFSVQQANLLIDSLSNSINTFASRTHLGNTTEVSGKEGWEGEKRVQCHKHKCI